MQAAGEVRPRAKAERRLGAVEDGDDLLARTFGGVAEARVTHAGQLIRTLIAAASADDKAEEEATGRFSAFFLVSAVADPKQEKLVASCKKVIAEFRRLEDHPAGEALVGSNDSAPSKPSFGPGDGE